MSDFVVKQGDTVTLNYQIPGVDLTFKKVIFCFGDPKNRFSKRIECVRQKVSSEKYTTLHEGGLAIPFKGSDLARAGTFQAQFEIWNKKDEKITYPQVGYLEIFVQPSV